ncbi:hypothetical protein OSTOST_12374 [Ostertagia ostertagi]
MSEFCRLMHSCNVLFQESVLERCGDAMAENILPNNVLRYLNLAEMYGLPQTLFWHWWFGLTNHLQKCWRWTGFNNGVDIVMNMSHGVLTMKRNCLSQATPYSINLKSERVVHYRVIISDGTGACLFDSTKQSIPLRLDQSVVVARLGDDIALPVSVHLLYLAAQPAPPSFLYVNQYIKDVVKREDIEVM